MSPDPSPNNLDDEWKVKKHYVSQERSILSSVRPFLPTSSPTTAMERSSLRLRLAVQRQSSLNASGNR